MCNQHGDCRIAPDNYYKVRKSKVTFVTALCLLGITLIEAFAMLYGRFAGGINVMAVDSAINCPSAICTLDAPRLTTCLTVRFVYSLEIIPPTNSAMKIRKNDPDTKPA